MKKGRFRLYWICSVLILLAMGGPASAATQTIQNGTTEGSLQITVRDNGMVGIYRMASDNVTWVEQIYGGDNKYFLLFLSGDNTAMRYTSTDSGSEWNPYDPYLTPVSNTLSGDGNSIVTVMDAGTLGVRWTQTVTKTSGAYVIYRWEIANTGSTTFTDLRAIDGEDTYFAGDDRGAGFWNPSQRMVYVRNSSGGSNGLMGFYTSAAYTPDMYHEGYYGDNYDMMATGTLDNTVDPTPSVDSGYSLGWKRASLAPGEIWTIEAFEKFIFSGDVQVIAPSEQTVDPGTDVTYVFEVSNFGEGSLDLNLTAVSQNSWTTAIQDSGGTPVSFLTIPGGTSDNVTVIVSVPPGATAGSTDLLTLIATDNTTPSLTGQDSTTTRVTGAAPSEVILFTKNTPNVGCSNIVVRQNSSIASSLGAAGLFLLPALLLLARRRIGNGDRRRRRLFRRLLLLLLAGVMILASSSLSDAGPLGPPQPSVKAGQFGAAIGYFYTEDKWEPDTATQSSGGVTVRWETDKVKQNSVFLRGAYGFSGNCEASVKVGIADRGAPQGFEDSYAFLAGVGAKGILYATPSFSVGPILDFTWYSKYEDNISFSQGGTTWSGTEEIEDSWDLQVGIGLQAAIGKGLIYGGPSFYWNRADVTYRISNGSVNLNVDNRYNQKDTFGGFAGVRFPISAKLGVEVEGQYRSEFSGGATILYSF